MKKKLSNKQAADAAIGLGVLSQVSRNPKIQSGGEVLIFLAIVAYIGEALKFILKWLVFKPCIFLCKLFFKMCVWTCQGLWYCTKLIYKIIKISIIKLIDYIKSRNEMKKAIN